MISSPKKSRPGFKETKLGWIPENWEIFKIDQVFSFLNSNSYSRSNLEYSEVPNGIRNIHYGDIHSTYSTGILDCNDFKIIPKVIDEIEVSKNYDRLKDGDIVIADVSEDYEGVGSVVELINVGDLKIVAGLHTFALRDNSSRTVIGFRNNLLSNEKVRNELKRLATGSKVYGISKYNFKKFEIIVPPIPEQKAIATCLSTWDTAITKLDTLIKTKQQLKKGLMQQLLSGKKRLPGFDREWEEKRLGEYFDQSTEKVYEDNSYEVLTSSRRGLVKQSDYYESGRLSSKSSIGFNVIKKNELTYRSRTDDGSFKFNLNSLDVDGCVSKYYPVFKSSGSILFFSYFLNYYNRKIGLYATGSSQLVLSFKELSKIRFKLPEKEEQTAIAKVLNTADQEIELLTTQRNQLQLQKKGLMQQLLTGKKRLRV
jgi:type I restriction enzyme S subunit